MESDQKFLRDSSTSRHNGTILFAGSIFHVDVGKQQARCRVNIKLYFRTR